MKYLVVLLSVGFLGCQRDVSPPEVEVELGTVMFGISNRFANIWYAAEAGNLELLKYQTHEIEEVVEDLQKAGVLEEGIRVGDEFATSVVPHLESMEAAVEIGDKEAFKVAYQSALTSCNSCHVRAGHPYLMIEVPQHNPYSNVRLAP